MKFKNLCAGILIGGLLATSGVFVGCGPNKDGSVLGSTTDIYGFAGATTGILASNQQLNQAVTESVSASTTTDDLKTKIDNAISNTLDKYMNVFDSVVGGKKPVSSTVAVSDKEGFKHKLTVTANSIDSETMTCLMYFNETLKSDGSDVEDSDDEERETLLEGEMYFNGSQTPLYVKGVKEIDEADGEVEVSFEAFLVKDNDDNKIVFKQEHEKSNGKVEEEFQFEIIVGGISTQFSFELEKDANGNLEVEYEQVVGNATISFEIEKKSDNSITISTKDFFGEELSINVAVEKDSAKGERYVYTIPVLGNFVIKSENWRKI